MHSRIIARGVATSIPLLLVVAVAANAASIRYSWSGRVEPAVGADNPWGLSGDGSSGTPTDGTPFLLEIFVDEAAIDDNGTQTPDVAEFSAQASLIIGDSFALADSPVLYFEDDAFEGLFDSIFFDADAELSGTTLYFPANVRLPAETFDLASPAAPDPPPTFAETAPIQFGAAGTPDIVTFPEDAPVTAVIVPWAAFPPATAVVWASDTAGSAGDVEVTLSGLGDGNPTFVDLSASAYEAAPFFSFTSALSFDTGSTWTVTFSEPIATLLLYTVSWRGSQVFEDSAIYHFDLPFSIRSGLEQATLLGNSGGLGLVLPTTGFHGGIVQIPGPLTSLTVIPNTDSQANHAMAMAVTPLPQAQPVEWTTPTTGAAGEIEVTMSDLGTSAIGGFDLSGADFAAAPLAVDEETLQYDTGANWTATLSEPVPGLLLYAKFWRGNEAGVDPVTYRFGAPFTILSGLRDAVVSESGMLLTLPADGFHDGILFFPGPLETLAVDSNSMAASSQVMTLAVVPEPGAAGAALASWLALLALRRCGEPRPRE